MQRLVRRVTAPIIGPMSMHSSSMIQRSFPRAIDAHCHLHDARLEDHVDAVLNRAAAWNLTHIATCACYEDDWNTLERLLSMIKATDAGESTKAKKSVTVVPSFGVHPWWANAKSDQYLDLLRDKLTRHPEATLGEIGLCKSARGKQVDRGVQEQVFVDQLRLAAELLRPCVIHCVGAYGKLLELLETEKRQNRLPPIIILHSFSGAADMVTAFLALQHKADVKVFFSLNAKQLSGPASQDKEAKPSKGEFVCSKVPLDALLLETDAPDQPPPMSLAMEFYENSDEMPLIQGGLNDPCLVQLAIQRAARIYGMVAEDLAAEVYKNSVLALRLDS